MKSQTVRHFLRLPVTDQESAETYLRMLVEHDCVYHLEDSPSQIIKGGTDEPLFTPREAAIVESRMRAIYALPWLGYDCPIAYLLQAIERWNLTKLSTADKFRLLKTIKWEHDNALRRLEVIAILEWNDSGGDFVDCTDAELQEILTDIQRPAT